MDADDDGPEAALEGAGQTHGQVDLLDAEPGLQVAGIELGPATCLGAARRGPGPATSDR